jgi:glycosyltransferase involved in cell wall biosynthesis
MGNKRILLVSPTPTHPQTAGNRARIDGLLTSLKRLGHDVYFCHVQKERGDEAAMRQLWGDRFLSLPYTKPGGELIRWKRRFRGLFNPNARYTYTIDEWYAPSIDDYILKLADSIRFDAVIVEYVFFSRVLELFGKDVLKIIDTHDVFTDRHLKYLDNKQAPRWYSTTREEEARGLNRADIVLAIQDKEREFFAGLTRKKAITVGHLVALHEPAQRQVAGRRILFVASANSINTGGINAFIAESLPAIRERMPDVELAIAGSVCQDIRDQPGIVKLGRVDDLAPAYASASVVINPVRFKTGLSIKNLEALGYSLPLVTSPAGGDGLEDGAGSAFLVAENAGEFSRQVIRLLGDAELAHGLAQRAYDYAAERNHKLIGQLEEVLA